MSDNLHKRPFNHGKMTNLSDLLFTECYDKVFRIIFNISKNEEESEDIVQEAFYKALVNIDQLQTEEKFCSWVTKIAINEMNNKIRKNMRERSLFKVFEGGAKEEVRSDPVLNQIILQTEVEDLLSILSPRDREILILKLVLGYSVSEIAHKLEIEPNYVSVRFHRAGDRLRAEQAKKMLDAGEKK